MDQDKRSQWGIFVTQACERFSFYGVAAVLVLFLVAPTANGGPGLDAPFALAVAGVFAGATYAMTVVGGWLADRVWGAQRTVLAGLVIAAVGYGFLVLPEAVLALPALAVIVVGTGLFTPNLSALLAGEVEASQGARDAAFSALYVSVNVGAFLSPIVIGFIGTQVNWRLAFTVNIAGIALAIVALLTIRKSLSASGRRAANPTTQAAIKRFWIGAALVVLALGLLIGGDALAGTLDGKQLVACLAVCAPVLPIVFLAKLFRRRDLSRIERRRLRAYVWLFIAAFAFWFMYSLKSGILLLLAQSGIDRHVAGWEFPATWFVSVDPLLVILIGPALVVLWRKLGDRNPTTPVKYGLAIAAMASAFALLALLGARADSDVTSPWSAMVVVFVAMTIAELLLAPSGSSVTTLLAPAGSESTMLALWYLSVGTGFALGGIVSGVHTVTGYGPYFLAIAIISAFGAIAMFAFKGRILLLMEGVR